MADVKLKHQASYGEAGMKSYFSSIFSTSFVFAFVLFLLDFLHCFVFVFAVCAILILALILILILIHESWILILIWLLILIPILNPDPDYSLSISKYPNRTESLRKLGSRLGERLTLNLTKISNILTSSCSSCHSLTIWRSYTSPIHRLIRSLFEVRKAYGWEKTQCKWI